MTTPPQFDRRGFLRRSLAVAAVTLPVGGMSACASSSAGSGTPQASGTASADNPFGVVEGSSVDAVVFNGGYGTDYVTYAAGVMGTQVGVTPTISPSTAISQELQPRFAGGNPPDLIDNAGAGSIGLTTIIDQLSDLNDVFDANNYEGSPIRDTLYEGVAAPGTFGDKLVAINYVLTVFGLWYSASLFEKNNWQPPTTWDEALDLGEKAKEQGRYLFVWGKEAASYYHTLVIESAIMQGGDEVRLAFENLQAGAYSQPAFQDALAKLETVIARGYFAPGGAGTQFTAAQAQWSNDQDAILYPAGSWIENEMKSQTAEGFRMTGLNGLTVDPGSAVMPKGALHSSSGEAYVVPVQGQNVAGAKELLRAMLSKDAATNFAKTRLSPTIVRDTVPADGFGSTALQSQTAMLKAAGTNVFGFNFVQRYGINAGVLTAWNSFLSGSIGAAELTTRMQDLIDKVREDDAVPKSEVK